MEDNVKEEAFSQADLFVAPLGNDNWSGALPEPNAAKTDGPFATIVGARDAVRRRKGTVFSKQPYHISGGIREPFAVWIRGGVYRVDSPILFDERDSAPVTYAAYPGEQPVIDGSRLITAWEEATVNGVGVWVADMPDVRSGNWSFRELFVNGSRAPRPRFPNNGLFHMAEVPGLSPAGSWTSGGGYTRFVAEEGNLKAMQNLQDVEVVFVHFWIEERSSVAALDARSGEVEFDRPSRAPLYAASGGDLADYYFDNVFDELKEPGQWYLDRAEGKLYYVPKTGETRENTEISAPGTLQLLVLQANAEENRHVEFLRFKGITFQNTDWRHPDSSDGADFIHLSGHDTMESRRNNRGNHAASSQAAADVPGGIMMEAARHCAFIDCTVRNVGWYGIEIADGCRGVTIQRCTISDTGAGGVKINGASAADPVVRRTGDNAIIDNEIRSGGRVFHSAVGVLCMHGFNNEIAHNHIHDFYYTAISCGWVWGYQESVSRDNRIEKNHIHNLGQGLLSDMGGIYTLGVQAGTVLRGNLIYDVKMAHYGGWCIYPDEGSSHMLIENNVCHSTNDTIFNQHYGRENMVRNNVFAFGDSAILSHGRAEKEHCSIRFERNIILTRGTAVFRGGYGCHLPDKNHTSDLNLLWDVRGKDFTFRERDGSGVIGIDEWKSLGHDHHSIVADPKCKDPEKGDFSLGPDSPAISELDFVPIDISDVGPRPGPE